MKNTPTAYKVLFGKITQYQVTHETPKGYRTTCGRTIYKERSYSNYSNSKSYNTERTVFDFEEAEKIREAQVLSFCEVHAEQIQKTLNGYGRQKPELTRINNAIGIKVLEKLLDELKGE